MTSLTLTKSIASARPAVTWARCLPPIPKAALLAVAMMGAFELGMSLVPRWLGDEPPYGSMTIQWKQELAGNSNDFDVLVLGDCFATSGVIPPLWQTLSGHSCLNLGVYVKNTFASSAALFDEYLRHCNRPPKDVIVILTGESLTFGKEFSLVDWESYVFRYVGRSDDVIAALNWRDRLLVRLSPPSVRKRDILSRFMQGKLWNLGERQAALKTARETFATQLGYVNVPGPDPATLTWSVESLHSDLQAWRPSMHNGPYLERILATCEARGIPVVLASNTLRADVLELWRQFGVIEDMDRHLADIANRYDCVRQRVNLLDALPGREWYRDQLHLRPSGSERFTQLLSEAVGADSSG